LRNGRYVLVHTADSAGQLREVSKANNSASVLLDVRWRHGSPRVRQIRACPDTARCDHPAARPAASKLHVRTVAKGLVIPWDIAFLPGGGAFVTERPGRVRLLDRRGRLQRTPVARIPVATQGEGGLLGVVVDPNFAANHLVYLYLTSATGMRLERWRWTGSRLVPEATLVDGIAAGEVHDSGRIAFGPDGRLYVATGDAGRGALAQDPASLNGKFLALTPEQYHGSHAVTPAVVASGLRNPQGFDWQPGTGALVSNDHGPSGFDGPEGYDEVDLIVPGGNYGWPNAIGTDTGGGRYRPPLRVYRLPLAPSGATFVHHAGSAWTGDYVLAALRGSQLIRLVLRDGRVAAEYPLLRNRYGRLRTVREAPNGDLCVLTSNRDGRGTPRRGDDRVLCVTPPAH
jgi:quinoprotein glucose dehydrogenase